MPRRPQPVLARFKSKLLPQNAAGCIEWGGTMQSTGYGTFWLGGKSVQAHRVSWELQRSPIPAGLHIDHLCRNPRCVNPDHLEPVTPRENVLRSPISPAALNALKTHCPLGHALTDDNLDAYMLKSGHRACKECGRRRCREWHHRNREARLAKMAQYQAARKAAIA